MTPLRISYPTLAAAIMATGLSLHATAQDNSSQELETVVVTASGFEQDVKEAPASITVISGEELRKENFRDLTDALRHVEGVTVTGVSNEKDIYIRGLPGAYTLILVDGKRQSTRQARTNGDSGIEQSFIPPVDAIERIEIVRGPMSTLYGSEALGGVINIITRKVPKKWGGSVGVDYTYQESNDYGNSHQEQFFIGGPIKDDVLGLQVWGRVNHRNEDRIISGTQDQSDRNLTARLSVKPSSNQEILLQAGREDLERRGNVEKTIAAFDNRGRKQTNSMNKNIRESYSLSHSGRWGFGNTELSILKEDSKRKNYSYSNGGFNENIRSPEFGNTVVDGKIISPWGNNLLTLGGQYIYSDLKDVNPGLKDETIRNFSTHQSAIFIENDFGLTDAWRLTAGLRMNEHKAYGSQWTPRLYSVWNATESLVIKGGVARGFKAPDIRQTAPGYEYTTGGGSGVALGNPDLRPETSTNYELSAIWDADQNLVVGATVFSTDFKNKIENNRVLDVNGNPVTYINPNGQSYELFRHENVDRAKVRGVELTADWRINSDLKFNANYAYTDSKRKSGQWAGYALARTPKNKLALKLDWAVSRDVSAWVSYIYHGKEINAGQRVGNAGQAVGNNVRQYESYQIVDVGFSYKVSKFASINTAFYNVTNKRLNVERHNTVGEGRRIWVGANFNF